MVTAFVLLNVARDSVNQVAQQLAAMDGVAEVHSIAGRFDLVAVVRVRDNEGLARIVTEEMRRIEGITASETLIGFRVVSRYDLDRMFTLGA